MNRILEELLLRQVSLSPKITLPEGNRASGRGRLRVRCAQDCVLGREFPDLVIGGGARSRGRVVSGLVVGVDQFQAVKTMRRVQPGALGGSGFYLTAQDKLNMIPFSKGDMRQKDALDLAAIPGGEVGHNHGAGADLE